MTEDKEQELIGNIKTLEAEISKLKKAVTVSLWQRFTLQSAVTILAIIMFSIVVGIKYSTDENGTGRIAYGISDNLIVAILTLLGGTAITPAVLATNTAKRIKDDSIES